MTTEHKFYNSLEIQSYNAIYNFVISNRNYGKTWGAQKRAFTRAVKHGKKTIWIRRFKDEAKEAADKLFQSPDLCKFIGCQWYDPDTKQGNIRRQGNKFYTKYKGKWIWFCQILYITKSQSMRSADDVNIDTVVFDEFTAEPDRYKLVRGNEVSKLIDSFISFKRMHQIKVFFFGNKESFTNPYFTYFNIPIPPADWQGIRTYRHGAIALQQINNKQDTTSDYEKKVQYLLEGTPYGSYLYQDTYKNQPKIKIRKAPANSNVYVQLDFQGNKIRIRSYTGWYYVDDSINNGDDVFCDMIKGKYQKERVLSNRMKSLFDAFKFAVSSGRVAFNSYKTYECTIPFLKWLGF